MAKAYVFIVANSLATIHTWLSTTPVFIVQTSPVFEHIHLQIQGKTVEYLTVDIHERCVMLVPQTDFWENAVECALVLKNAAPVGINIRDKESLFANNPIIYWLTLLDPVTEIERVPLAMHGDDPTQIPPIPELE